MESCDGEEAKEEEVDKGEDKGNEVGEEGEDDGDGDEVKLTREPSKVEVEERTLEGGSSVSSGDGHTRPFILPKMWTANDFKPTTTANIFKNLKDRYQIPNHPNPSP